MPAGVLQVQVLGPLAVARLGRTVPVRSARERCLLARLAVDVGRPVPVPDLVATLWDDGEAPVTAAKTLQTYVLRLRDLLEPDRAGAPAILVRDPAGYALSIDPLDVDAGRFSELAASGRRAAAERRWRTAAELLRQSLDTWRGAPYGDLPGRPAFVAEARRLDELRLQVLEECWTALIEVDDRTEPVDDLERAVAENPYRERLWELLLVALYRRGRQGDALAAFDRVRRLLRDDLGVDPGPSLRRTYARVLAQDPALAAGARIPPALVPSDGPLLGRRSELAVLQQAWHRSLDAGPLTVAVTGPAGAGATRLTAELAAFVVQDGAEVGLVTRETPDTPGTADRSPDLLVADGTDGVPVRRGRRLTLVLGRSRPVGDVDIEVPLKPLELEDVRGLLRLLRKNDDIGAAPYDGANGAGTDGPHPTDPDDATLDGAARQVLARSGGWPAAAVEEAEQWVRRAAQAQVAVAAERAESSAARHREDRRDLVAGVASLLTGAERADGWHPATEAEARPPCPWPGLAAYDAADAPWFAGRERLVAQLVGHVQTERLVLLLGDSGSGKSSLVGAGLVAAAAAGAVPGGSDRAALVMRPGQHPMRDVVKAVLQVQPPADTWDGSLRRLLSADTDDGPRPLLVVDQLEELWAQAAQSERTAFLDLLVELVAQHDGPTLVLVTRTDAVGDLAATAPVLVDQAGATVIVGPPSDGDLRRAITVPARRGGLSLDLGLVDAVVEDARGQAAVLPLLSTAMARIWETRSPDSDGRSRLHLRDYVATGGLAGAVAGLAEGVHGRLDADARAAARTVLLRLGSVDATGTVSRRRVAVDDLTSLPGGKARAVVDALVAARLVTAQDGTVEVAHEALFREWPRLRHWLEDDVAGRAQLRRLSEAALEWEHSGRDAALLWRGSRLEAVREAAQRHPDELLSTERSFLEAAEEHTKAEAHRARRAAGRLRLLLLGTTFGLVLAVVAGSAAWRSTQEARQSAREEQAERLSALAAEQEQHDLALLTALEAVRTQDTAGTRGALLGTLARAPDVLTQVRTPDRFLDLAMSPDGATAYLLESEATLRALDARTGAPRWVAELPAQPSAVAVSPDGRELLVAWDRGEVEGAAVHSASDGTRLREVPGSELGADTEIGAAAWLDPTQIVLATPSHLVRVNPATGRATGRLPLVPAGPVVGLHPLADGRLLLQPRPGQVTRVADLRQATVQSLDQIGIPGAPSPDGRLLPTLVDLPDGSGNAVVMRDTNTWRAVTPPRPLGGWSETHRWTSWSPDGDRLLATRGPDVVRLDPRTGEVLGTLGRVHAGGVMRLAHVGDDRVWSAGRDGVAALHDLSAAGPLRTTTTQPDGSRYGAVVATGAVALVPGPDGSTVQRWSTLDGTGTRRVLDSPVGCRCEPTAVAADPSGAVVVAGADLDAGTAGAVLVWRGSQVTATVIDLPWRVLGVGVTSDAEWAVVNGERGWAVLDLSGSSVELRRTEEASTVAVTRFTQSVAAHPQGNVVAMARGADVVVVDGSGRRQKATTLPGGDDAAVLVWSTDGERLYVGSRRGDLHVLHGDSLLPARAPQPAASGYVGAVATSPDGALLATVGMEGDLRLWDTRSASPLGGPFEDEGGNAWAVFTDDHAVLLHREGGTTVRWEVDPDRWRAVACAAAGRQLTDDEWASLWPSERRRDTC